MGEHPPSCSRVRLMGIFTGKNRPGWEEAQGKWGEAVACPWSRPEVSPEASLCSGLQRRAEGGSDRLTGPREEEKFNPSLVNEHLVRVDGRASSWRKSGNLEGGKCLFLGIPSSRRHPPCGRDQPHTLLCPTPSWPE